MLIDSLGVSAAADLRDRLLRASSPLFASHIQAEVDRLNVRDCKA